MDFSFLAQGGTPVQLPDPLAQLASVLKISGLQQQNQVGQMGLDERKRAQAAQDALNTSLPSVMQGNWSDDAIREAIRQNPQSAGPLLDMLDKKRKSDADYRKTNAGASKDEADAAKTDLERRAAGIGHVANAAAQGAPVSQLLSLANSYGVKLPMKPDDVSDEQYIGAIASVNTDPKSQAEILKINKMLPLEMAASQATTAKTTLETQQLPAELANKTMTARASQTSAGAAASNAATNRAQYEQPNLQHVGTPETGISVFNPRSGVVAPALGADGKPSVAQPKLTEKARNEISGLQAEYGTVGQAIELAKKSPDAFGVPRGMATEAGPMAESLVGRGYSDQENQARAAVFNTVSSVIKERAGTAQSKQELTRINSFMPGPYDDVPQIEAKFRGYQNYLKERAQGFAQPVGEGKGILADSPKAPSKPQLGEVRDGYLFKGGDPGSKSSWEKVN